jgi:Micrococcal nuclease (thermonuclease) homologs
MNPNIDPTQKKKGTIKGVPSGDTVVFQGPPGKDGIPLEKTLRLNGINAPRLGDNEKQDEPLAYEAREFLRQRLIGREVFFYIENKFNDREYGRVIVDDEDVGALLLQEGLAKLLEDMKNKPYNYDKYREAQDSAQKKSKGVWSANAQKSVRTLAPIENPKKVLDKYKGTKLAGVVEEFRNGLFHVYVPELQSIIRITFPGIFIQVGNFKASQDVRMFLEATYLHRDVNINITNYDDKYNYFFGTITVNDNPKYNPIVELLKNGYARLTQSAVVELDAAEFKTAKAAQDEAQSKKLRMWSNFEGKKEGSATSAITGDKEFYGRVLEVHSGDTLTVENLAKGEVLRINLSNVRAPGVGNPKRNELPKPWGFEAKEFVRSQVMGI